MRTHEPDKYCVTQPDGECTSSDPRCVHQPKPAPEATLSRGDLLHVAKWVLFKTTVLFTLEESEETRDLHWQGYPMARKRLLLAGLTRGLSEVGIEIEERRQGPQGQQV